LYQQENSWKKAVENYHSKEPKTDSSYIKLVIDNLQKIIDNLRAAGKVDVSDDAIKAIKEIK
jgi:hypothetical protein